MRVRDVSAPVPPQSRENRTAISVLRAKLLASALRYAERGMYVHPLLVGAKEPRWTNWEERATRDPEVIERTWGRAPFNIGVACTDAHLGTPIATRAAVIVDDDAAGVSQRTFAELAADTTRFAGLLRQLGCAPGDRVLIRLPNHLAYPTAFLGALKRGAIPVPTSMQLTADEVQYVAENSGAVVLVTDHATWNAMHAMLETTPLQGK